MRKISRNTGFLFGLTRVVINVIYISAQYIWGRENMWHNQEAVKQALARYLDPNDEAFGDALGVLTGVMTADFVGIGKVEITLTDEERAELLSAIIKSQKSWFGFSLAHYMGPELESLVCGHKPERYRILEALS